ncbi:MAG TPA: phage tail tube protein [Tenuifilaceae bacterium]|nr:phage tail tube protein [Tenuifilaceae bacterium]
MAEINGSKILLKLNVGGTDKLIAGQVSGTHDLKVDTFQTNTKTTTGAGKTFEGALYSVTYKIDCQVDPNDTTNAKYSDVYAAAKAMTAVNYTWGSLTAGEKKYTGKGIITSLSQAAPMAGVITFSIDLQVTGEETEGTVS